MASLRSIFALTLTLAAIAAWAWPAPHAAALGLLPAAETSNPLTPHEMPASTGLAIETTTIPGLLSRDLYRSLSVGGQVNTHLEAAAASHGQMDAYGWNRRGLLSDEFEAASDSESAFATLVSLFDVHSEEIRSRQADWVYLLIPTPGVQPFLNFAHDYSEMDEDGRMGLGVGVRWTLSPSMNINSQVLFYPSENGPSQADHLHRETQVMTRFEYAF